MTDRDLTPAEARAEVKAFMGEGWTVIATSVPDDAVLNAGERHAAAWSGSTHVYAFAPTYRAAVDALKQAWRDAVRPWCIEAAYIALTHDVVDYRGDDTDAPECIAAEAVARVLKEDPK